MPAIMVIQMVTSPAVLLSATAIITLSRASVRLFRNPGLCEYEQNVSGPVQLRVRLCQNLCKWLSWLEIHSVNNANGVTHWKTVAQTRRQQLITHLYICRGANMKQLQSLANAGTLSDKPKIISENLYWH